MRRLWLAPLALILLAGCGRGTTPASTPTTAAPTVTPTTVEYVAPVNAPSSYIAQVQAQGLQNQIAELQRQRDQAVAQSALDAQIAQNRQWRQEDYARCLEFNAASRANNVHAACVQPGP